jgi:hypothetical protein
MQLGVPLARLVTVLRRLALMIRSWGFLCFLCLHHCLNLIRGLHHVIRVVMVDRVAELDASE